jgi:DegV family protein with EDD domain
MGSIKLVTDSACDLPPALCAELGIEVVPLSIRFGSEEFVDRKDLTPEQFWAKCDGSATLPETSAPSPGAFESAYRRAAAEGADGVVCVTISLAMSATGQAAQLAAGAVGPDIPVKYVDSRNASLGEGMIVVAAARAAAAGKGIEDVAGLAEDLVARTRLFGVIETLENLKKGGRIGGAQAFLGSMLSIKPIITVKDGEVGEEAKQRTRAKALGYVVDKVKSFGALDGLGIMHAQAPDVDQLLTRLDGVLPRQDIIVADIGAVIGTHVGKGCIGLVAQVKPGTP